MPQENKRGLLRIILDFFAMLSGITTESTLERAQRGPVTRRGLFLIRKPADERPPKSNPNP